MAWVEGSTLMAKRNPQRLSIDAIKARCSTNEQGCWIWKGSANASGYGNAKHDGKTTEVHRLALTLVSGAPPTDGQRYEAAHGPCHNRRCCNPAHLSWKTPAGNQRDRKRDGTDPVGERHGGAKLTAEQVQYIRDTYTPRCREYGAVPLGRKFGVESSAVRKAASGTTWKHL